MVTFIRLILILLETVPVAENEDLRLGIPLAPWWSIPLQSFALADLKTAAFFAKVCDDADSSLFIQ